MKTNEFIKEIEDMEMGLHCKKQENYLNIYYNYYHIATIDMEHIFVCDTNHKTFNQLNKAKKQQLFNTIVEYISTPIEKREEEKKYRYYLKCVRGMTMLSNVKCLNLDMTTGEWFLHDEYNVGIVKASFTHTELKSLGIDIEQLQELYEEVEVEE